MKTLISFFLGHPLRIASVAVVFFAAAWAVHRFLASGPSVRTWPLLVTGGLWAATAAWEFAVYALSPEANIRVDLLLICPVLLIASIAAIVMQVWLFMTAR